MVRFMPMPRLLRPLSFLIPEPGPQRVYVLSSLVGTFGFGLFVFASSLYFTRVVHLSIGEVGLGLSIAGLIGLVAGIPMGDLADRRGPREMVRVMYLVQFLTTLSYVFIHNFVGFVVVATVDMLAMSASESAGGPLTRRVGGEDAASFRAVTRAVTNLGISFGAVGCGIAVQIDTPDAYRALIIVNALSFLACAVISGRLPHYEPLPQPESGPRWGALTDKAFVVYSAHAGAISIQYFVIMLPLPLWIVTHTSAPRWSISLFTLINTILCVLFQVRVGKNVQTVRQGGAALRRAGVIFLVSCSAIGFAADLPGWAALLLLAGAIALHTYGELWHASAQFALDFGLAPAHAQGQYQGLLGMGLGAGQAVAPVLLIGVCLSLGQLGWVGLGVFFAVLGLLAPPLVRWGERTRPGIAGMGAGAEDSSVGELTGVSGTEVPANVPVPAVPVAPSVPVR
jgi:Major Facilitator Superfamily